jgi:hypothetical protein
MQLGEMAIGSVLLAILIMASVVTQAVTLPTAALAIEAGPLGRKSERTEATPHRERVEYPVRIILRKYACFAAVQVAPGLRILPRKLAITLGEAHDANAAPGTNRRLEWVAQY